MERRKLTSTVVIICIARNANIGEKSSIIPGPPSGERCISRLIGPTIGSVKAERILKMVPIMPSGLKGIHDIIMRAIKIITKNCLNISKASANIKFTAHPPISGQSS